jgi:hypothetical protein
MSFGPHRSTFRFELDYVRFDEADAVQGFLARLQSALPRGVDARALCTFDEDGDVYVEVEVPDRVWARRLAETFAEVTLQVLREKDVYVGLQPTVNEALRGWGAPA